MGARNTGLGGALGAVKAVLGVALAILVLVSSGRSQAQTTTPGDTPGPAVSTTAERVYAAARPELLQVRTLVTGANRQSLIGSAFLVSADGLAITNYHVVSQYALEPTTYRLEYAAADGTRGTLSLLAIDVANDLAVVQLQGANLPFLQFDERALHGTLTQGERLYSMGNPLDLGFTIVEGTYNGLVERSYNERIHFSGAVNPGMSGGPAVTAATRVVGVNVAKQFGGELVSFLVPARYAAALLERARTAKALSPDEARSQVGHQVSVWQDALYGAIEARGLRSTTFGPYTAPENAAPWFTCWGQTNADQVPKPRAIVDTTDCNSDTRLFIAEDLNSGLISISQSYIRSIDLNSFQFAAFLASRYRSAWIGRWVEKWYTHQKCHDNFVTVADGGVHPPLRVIWCARAYQKFDDLYDVSVLAITQDRGTEALVSRFVLQGVAYGNAVKLTKRLLEAVRWTK